MNLFKFIYKFVLIDVSTNKFSFVNLFPFVAQFLGIVSIMITLTVMNGLEDSIYNRLKIFNLFDQVTLKDYDFNLEEYLDISEVDYLFSSNIDLIASNSNRYAPVNLKTIDNFNDFSKTFINKYIINFRDSETSKSIYIGQKLSSKLNVKVGDSITLINPNELNFFTTNPRTLNVTIEGIFSSQILDIDQSYIFADNKILDYISNNSNKSIHILNSIDKHPELMKNISLNSWKEKHANFIEAYNNEKILYSSFGLIVVIISAFTLSGVIAISIRKRLVHMSILRALGYERVFFFKVYTCYVSLFSAASFIISFLFAICLYKIDIEYRILEFFFPPYLYFPFEIAFDVNLFMIIFFAVYIVTLLSTLTSIYTIYKIDIATNLKKI